MLQLDKKISVKSSFLPLRHVIFSVLGRKRAAFTR